MDILIVVVLIIFNGLFAMSEIALVSAKKSRLQRMAENGSKSAELAIKYGENPTQFLSTVQIGITAIGLLNGIFGEAALAEPFAQFITSLGVPADLSSVVSTVCVVVTITYLSIVVGELVPKRLGQFNPEMIAVTVARPVSILSTISKPFVFLLTISTNGILRLVGENSSKSDNLTEDDLHALIHEGSQSGLMEKQEHDIVRNALRLDTRHTESLMTPRSEIIAIDIEDDFEEALSVIQKTRYSRFPVCRGGLQDILGVVSAKGLLRSQRKASFDEISKDLLPAIYIPESLTGIKLLEQFRKSEVDMVFVVDEYGEVGGIVTLHDVLKALTGEFTSEDATSAWTVRQEDGSYIFDGLIPLPDLQDQLGLKKLPEQANAHYHTLSGMLMWLLGSVPQLNDVTSWADWQFTVIELDGNRIEKVHAQLIEK